MPKICRTCNEKKALNKENWWKDNRYPDGWSTKCKRCSRIQMRKIADSKSKEVHCVICNKLFTCFPDTSKRYRLTCSRWHQKRLIANNMLVRYGKRNHAWNFTPDGSPLVQGTNEETDTDKQRLVKKEMKYIPWSGSNCTDFPAQNDPF